MLALDENGAVASGLAGMVIKTKEGVWIIDHKSDRGVVAVVFSRYRQQLDAYIGLLTSTGENVLGVGVNWTRQGKVALNHLV